MRLKVLVQPEESGGFSVSVPALPGCHSQGETLDEALEQIREAIDLWVEVQAERAVRDSSASPLRIRLEEIEI